eukprot:gene6952-8294_t
MEFVSALLMRVIEDAVEDIEDRETRDMVAEGLELIAKSAMDRSRKTADEEEESSEGIMCDTEVKYEYITFWNSSTLVRFLHVLTRPALLRKFLRRRWRGEFGTHCDGLKSINFLIDTIAFTVTGICQSILPRFYREWGVINAIRVSMFFLCMFGFLSVWKATTYNWYTFAIARALTMGSSSCTMAVIISWYLEDIEEDRKKVWNAILVILSMLTYMMYSPLTLLVKYIIQPLVLAPKYFFLAFFNNFSITYISLQATGLMEGGIHLSFILANVALTLTKPVLFLLPGKLKTTVAISAFAMLGFLALALPIWKFDWLYALYMDWARFILLSVCYAFLGLSANTLVYVVSVMDDPESKIYYVAAVFSGQSVAAALSPVLQQIGEQNERVAFSICCFNAFMYLLVSQA